MKPLHFGSMAAALMGAGLVTVRPVPNDDPAIYFFEEADDLRVIMGPPDYPFEAPTFYQPRLMFAEPTFQPMRKKTAVRADLAAPTFKSKRVKANRKRKRAARKARRAQA